MTQSKPEQLQQPRRWKPIGVLLRSEIDSIVSDLKNRPEEWNRLQPSDRELIEQCRGAFLFHEETNPRALVCVFPVFQGDGFKACVVSACDNERVTLTPEEVQELSDYAIGIHEAALNPINPVLN